MKAIINNNKITGKLQNLNFPVAKQVGIQGAVGPAGKSFSWKGNYDPIVTYNLYDVVSYDGSVYIATQDNFFGILPSDPIYWDKMLNSGGGNLTATVDVIAGENIAPYRVVYVDTAKVYKANKDTLSERDKILGLTDGAYTENSLATIYVNGTISNGGWNWNSGIVYLDIDGALTQTLPTSGFLVQIGKVINSTTIILDIDRVIEDHNHDLVYINEGEDINGGNF